MTDLIALPLRLLLEICYEILRNYIFSIILFTALTKVILFPVSLWTQRNSIKMVELTPELNRLKIKYYGDKDTIAEETQALYKRMGYHPLASTVPMFIQLALLIGVIGAVRTLLEGTDSLLSVTPFESGGLTLLTPLAAGLSALALGQAQNHLNPLQREQSPGSQWATNGFSIAISLALGAFVPVGVGIYWIASNLFTIAQQLALNAVMPPRKYVDYTALAKSKAELAEIEGLSSGISKEDKQRERADYKRFFSVANKHLVFYSEKSGFYKYFQDVIEYLLSHSNIIIHYVTSDPKDQVFKLAETQPRIRPYYIGEKRLITLMMKMDADMVVMTMPDLDNFHIKRSYVRKDVEYVFISHGIGSINLLFRKLALAHYDTIFCVGEYQAKELREEEHVYGLAHRKLVPCGYGLLDRVMELYTEMPERDKEKPQILIAPSWQKDNILDTCIDPILETLLSGRYHVILRPHPEYCKRYPQKIVNLQERYKTHTEADLAIQTDFSSNETVFQSDLVITDWSTICCEFSFATKRPTLFIDTPMKIMNPEYQRLKTPPMDLMIREVMGKSLDPTQINSIGLIVEDLLQNCGQYQEKIEQLIDSCLYSRGESGKRGGDYIIQQLKKKQHTVKEYSATKTGQEKKMNNINCLAGEDSHKLGVEEWKR